MSVSSHFLLENLDPTPMYKVAETDTALEHPPSIEDTQPANDRPSLSTETQGGPVTAPVHLRESWYSGACSAIFGSRTNLAKPAEKRLSRVEVRREGRIFPN